MKNYKYVIIGGGTTAGYAAKEFAEQNIEKGELCIVSAESILPMNRPPLSKDYLRDKTEDDEVLIEEKDFYENQGIDVKLETCAKDVELEKKQVLLDNEEKIGYNKLLIATGSKLKRLHLDGSGLENIFYLRNIKHSDKIRERAKKANRVVVVGGGYIGTETAASLNQMGLDVTMIVPEEILLSRFASNDIAAFFQKEFEKRGVKILFNKSVERFHGKEQVEEVELDSGEKLKTDMVVAGIGVEPNVILFKTTPLKINKGIVVNEYCETNIEDVYAAGDVVEFPDALFNKRRHVEHWEHAVEQGKHAARVMTGKKEPYTFLPFFFSDVFDYSYEYFGDNETAKAIYYRGNIDTGDFSAWWFDANRLVAAFIMSSRPEKEGEMARKWIANKTPVEGEKIQNDENNLEDLEVKDSKN
ncbi:MAG: FAD-dependent oxidoreductase [Bacteroides sp.]|jgi:NADPH-dependent 2,4-dienoyl-CoA reductase/sulfur reductase-like enzyme|nr:FAD-dependent oxidoreductase [Bacteroides sp.]